MIVGTQYNVSNVESESDGGQRVRGKLVVKGRWLCADVVANFVTVMSLNRHRDVTDGRMRWLRGGGSVGWVGRR